MQKLHRNFQRPTLNFHPKAGASRDNSLLTDLSIYRTGSPHFREPAYPNIRRNGAAALSKLRFKIGISQRELPAIIGIRQSTMRVYVPVSRSATSEHRSSISRPTAPQTLVRPQHGSKTKFIIFRRLDGLFCRCLLLFLFLLLLL